MNFLLPLMYVLFSFSLSAYALDCPEGGTAVKVDLGYKTLNFCQMMYQGQLVKHGPEESVDSTGKVNEIKYYQYGVEKSAQTVMMGEKTVDTLKILFRAFLPFFGRLGTETFFVSDCPIYPVNWVGLIVFKRALTSITYKFSEKCNAEGTVTQKEKSGLVFALDFKNLAPFGHLSMTLNCTGKPVGSASEGQSLIDFDCATDDGVLSPAAGEVNKGDTLFKASYSLTINEHSKTLMHDNKGGKISLSQLFGKPETSESKILIK